MNINAYNNGLFKEVEIIPLTKQNTNNKTIEIKSLNGYDGIREKLDEGNTINVENLVINEQTKPKTKVSIGL